jgi:GntR family transcriptional regulator / MocR family aminotransferase
MRRRSELLFTLGGDEKGPLHRRLYRRMRGLILDGSWPTGTRLPSSRALAEELGISRNTALHAIELLVADGWVRTRQGSAAFVSEQAPAPNPRLGQRRRPLSSPRPPVPFEMGRQSAEFFPRERWNVLQSDLWSLTDSVMLYGADAGGWPPLRRAIAAFVGGARGLSVDPDQVIVLSSTQAAIDLITRVLAGSGDRVWVEDPGYPLAHQLFRSNGLMPVAVPVDADGLRVASGMRAAPDARFAYVMPACHFPSGRSMSGARRRALLGWARERQAWIIEDDWEWHARFDGEAVPPPLQSLPGGDRVIYVQTFNRTIFPGLRLAFLVAPTTAIAETLIRTYEQTDGGPNVPLQATLARFLEEGLYAAHLRTTRAAYAARRDALLSALGTLPPGFVPLPRRHGLHLVIGVPAGLDDARIAGELRTAGIACMGLGEFALSDLNESGLVLGFAAFSPEELAAAAGRLIEALRRIAR